MTVALTVGLLTFGAFYLFSKRELLRVILGMVLLGHAANLAIIAAGGTDRRGLPFAGTSDVEVQADALPQAFVLTAIVIAFAITVLLLTLAVTGAHGTDPAAVDALTVPADVVLVDLTDRLPGGLLGALALRGR